MIPVKIEDKSYVLPTSWKDVSVKMFYRLQGWREKGGDIVEFYAILLDVDRETMFRVRQMDVDRVISTRIGFLQLPIDVENLPMPDYVTVKNQKIMVPKNLELESFGQKIMIDQELARISKEDISGIDKQHEQVVAACLIYFYKGMNGVDFFDYSKALDERKWIDQAPIVDMLPVATFFFRRHYGYPKSKRSYYLTSLISRKAQQVRKGLTGIFSKPWIRLPRGTS